MQCRNVEVTGWTLVCINLCPAEQSTTVGHMGLKEYPNENLHFQYQMLTSDRLERWF